jgi:hypothetical protein
VENQEAIELAEHDNALPLPDNYYTRRGVELERQPVEEEPNPVLEDIVRQLHEGAAAIQELNMLKPTLGLLLTKLPKKQLRIRLEDAATMGEKYGVQAKSDGAGGIILRSVNL